ncbi:MAG: hypothetical protein Kow0031_04880 [Anaerolineae bacterium]
MMSSKNPAFQQTLLALSHPVSLLAMATLLLNALLWQRFWPSWVTGKLGDVAWLCFAPFVLALPLAWLWPARPRRVGATAIMLTGLAYALVKAAPPVNAAALAAFAAIGFPAKLTLDATDLLALPALLLAWAVWQRPPRRQPSPAGQWAALSLAALALLADSPGPQDNGISCLLEPDPTTLVALREVQNYNYFGDNVERAAYRSKDGGLTWTPDPAFETKYPDCAARWPLPVPGVADVNSRYLYAAGGGIYRTDDGGDTMRRELSLGVVYDTHYFKATQHSLIAAGPDGVWVRTATSEWRQTLAVPEN